MFCHALAKKLLLPSSCGCCEEDECDAGPPPAKFCSTALGLYCGTVGVISEDDGVLLVVVIDVDCCGMEIVLGGGVVAVGGCGVCCPDERDSR